LSAIGQSGSLIDLQMCRSLIDGFHLFDFYYVLVSIVFVLIFQQLRMPSDVKQVKIKIVFFVAIMIVLNFFSHFLWCSLHPEYRYVSRCVKLFCSHHFSQQLQMVSPKFTNFERGSIRCLFAEFYVGIQGTVDLTEEQLIQIRRETKKPNILTLNSDTSHKNVIFIIVESYMSFTSDMRVNGIEITPFFNSLKRDSLVYYNGMMNENVTVGESSDGQFIYMTGLLPLRSLITVSKARKVTLPGLPQLIKKESRMIIPTIVSMWNQDEMCRQYGFDHLYASNDYSKEHETNLNDEQVFSLAIEKDKSSKQPFFSVILTMSMHQPYTKQIDSSFPINDSSIPNDLACYLNACHYTDHHLQRYFTYLKESGLYDNSLIIIAADHSVHNTNFGGVSKKIPLYIIHPTVNPAEMSTSECNQLDVYPTLLDLLGYKGRWRGLGSSLLTKERVKDIPSKSWDVSELIIMGNYFSKDTVR
jgi:lipoteichoic acid synthase